MAGKEYKASSKKVQKMSRNGLIEENLRTGEKKRAVIHDTEGIRIGDRPMESFEDEGTAQNVRKADRSLRLNRHGTLITDTESGGIYKSGKTSLDKSDNTPKRHKKNKKKKSHSKESSFQETPSSMKKSLEESPFIDHPSKDEYPDRESIAHGKTFRKSKSMHVVEEDADTAFSGDIRDTRDDTYHTLRKSLEDQEKGPFSTQESNAIADEGSNLFTNRKRILRQKSTVQYQKENGIEQNHKLMSDYRQDSLRQDLNPEKDAVQTNPSDESVNEEPIKQQSMRGQQIRGHPSGTVKQTTLTVAEFHHGDIKPVLPDYTVGKKSRKSRLRETSSDLDGLDPLKEEIKEKQKKNRLYQEQRKSYASSKLSFDDGNGMIRGSGTGYSRNNRKTIPGAAFGTAANASKAAASTAAAFGHAKVYEAESEEQNVGIQAAHDAEMTAENSVRSLASHRTRNTNRRFGSIRHAEEGAGSRRLQFEAEDISSPEAVHIKKSPTDPDKKTAVKKFLQKQRQRRMYYAAKKEEKTVESIFRTQQSMASKAATVLREAFVRHANAFIIAGITGLIFIIIAVSVSSCSSLIQGAGSSVISTTYPSSDEDIYAVENRYRELEAELDAQIYQMQQTHPTYDEFRFQIDEISHNPYHLISYFTAKYGQFTYEQVKDELEEIFREQYTLTTSGEQGVTITETRTVRPGDSLGQVTTSGYCSCEICCGQWAGGTTASGTYPMADHTLAVDAFNPFVPIGTHVIMNGVEYVVEDTGSFDSYGVQFDVYYDDHLTAMAHGHQVWDAYLAEGGGITELELTTTRTVDRMSVVLTNHDLDLILQERLTDAEKVRYSFYNLTFGNRNYLFDLNNLPRYGSASRDYSIPPEALSDERFARLIAEAESHLGTPYVWGGYAPGGFDCSGFVSWVINHCGNGWDIGRQTAEGIRQICYYVSPEEAQPGDIIFFENTYETAGASHVGIYVGDGMMIHAGEPVQYTSINTPYWQDHFMEFGRLP